MSGYRSLIFISVIIITLFCCLGLGDGTAAASGFTGGAPEDDYSRLFDNGIFHHLTINITSDEWAGMCSDMKQYAAIDPSMRTQNYRRADLSYEDDYGKIELGSIGVRTHGNTARETPETDIGEYARVHFAFKFNETFGLSEADDGYFNLSGRTFCGLDKLILKWNQWEDYSHIREAYCYDALNNAGINAPKASLASLDIVIGGKSVHYGVYTIIEPIDKKFLTKRFGRAGNDGDLYKCLWESRPATLENTADINSLIGVKDWVSGKRYSYDLKTNKSTADFSSLDEFIDNLNTLGDNDFAKYIYDNFDVDSFLKLCAMNVLLGNPDDYRSMGNNYYLYFNRYGKIVMIPYDYNASLGAGWDGRDWGYLGIAEGDIYTWRNIDSFILGKKVTHPLFDRIMNISEYKQKYEYYLQDFIDSGIFSFQSFDDMFGSFRSLYGDYASSDTREAGEEMKLSNEKWYFDTKINSVESQLYRQ